MSNSYPPSPAHSSPVHHRASEPSSPLQSPVYGHQSILQFIHAIATPLNHPHPALDDTSEAFRLPSPSNSWSSRSTHMPMSSSLHAIHKPLRRARTLKLSPINTFSDSYPSREPLHTAPPNLSAPSTSSLAPNLSSLSIDDDHTSQSSSSSPPNYPKNLDDDNMRDSDSDDFSKKLTSVDDRRTVLANKLKEIFNLDAAEEVLAEYPCWLFRSILLQGFLYVTRSRFCFFSYLPRRKGDVLRSGTLSKKSSSTRRYNKYWFILKDDVLSWFPSSSNPYFPSGSIDLHYATSIDASPNNPRHFRIITPENTFRFSSEAETNRDVWVKTLRKAVFRCQNEGESVKISIPFEAVVDIDKFSTEELSSMIRVKVYEGEEGGFALDEFFFTYFKNIDDTLDTLRHCVTDFRTQNIPPHSQQNFQQQTSNSPPSKPSSVTSTFKLSRLSESPPSAQSHLPSSSSPSSSSFSKPHALQEEGGAMGMSTNIYPPPTSPRQAPASLTSSPTRENTSWSLTSWFKSTQKWTYPSGSTLTDVILDSSRKVTEIVSSPLSLEKQKRSTNPASSTSSSLRKRSYSIYDDDAINIPDDQTFEQDIAREKSANILSFFALPATESVLLDVNAYLYRSLPVYGKLYVTQSYICFRATNVLFKTVMILPINDVTALQRLYSFRFGYSTLILVIKGHEELFFEFTSSKLRNSFQNATQTRMEAIALNPERHNANNKDNSEACILRDLELASSSTPTTGNTLESDSAAATTMNDSISSSGELPPVMFRSNSSAMIDFKPSNKMRFTCLTIGSRGDVQPYIALCKGLMLDGHTCKIVTHPEYGDWIRGHGIEFAAVGGDPAELMRICVENGTFTYSFFREGITKFRGWLADLLVTSWEACQGSDVLIESPSAMAGIHIAEALRIPYFRAFTMPWTRTRTYPHAFGVPERKMGGSFNYMTYVLFENVHWRAISGQINTWRKDLLGLQPTTSDKLQSHRVPFLYNFSPNVVPPPLDWFEWIHVTGYWFLDNPDDSSKKKWEPPESLVKFMERAKSSDKKLVYIGFGSIVVSDPEGMSRIVHDAVRDSGVCAIVSKGWSDRLSSKSNPEDKKDEKEVLSENEDIYLINAVPHDWLFPRMDAICHHGGAGTTGASLRAGVPTIIRPFFGDQFFWAERIESLGVGSALKVFTTEALAMALACATKLGEKQASKAAKLGEQIRSEGGVDKAIQAIYRDMEYARSLIKIDGQDAGSIKAKERERDKEKRGDVSKRKLFEKGYDDSGNGRDERTFDTSASGVSDDGSWDRVSSQGGGYEGTLSPGSPYVLSAVGSGDDGEGSRSGGVLFIGSESE